MKEKTSYPHIVIIAEVCGGRAHIEGRRVRVQDVVYWTEIQGMSVDVAARELKITPAEAHLALAFYFDDPELIKNDFLKDREIFERIQGSIPAQSKLE